MAINLNLDLLISSLNQGRGKIMRGFSDKWDAVVNQTVHLTIPRVMLLGWGTMILTIQTITILVPLEIFLQIAAAVWLIIFILFRQYCNVWRRYYSLFWPIFIHSAALVAAIFIKAGCF